jgi:hypothetical protein
MQLARWLRQKSEPHLRSGAPFLRAPIFLSVCGQQVGVSTAGESVAEGHKGPDPVTWP